MWLSSDYDGDGDDSGADEDVDDGDVTINDNVRWQLDYHDYMFLKLVEAYCRD